VKDKYQEIIIVAFVSALELAPAGLAARRRRCCD
jgi:hypothetical protein